MATWAGAQEDLVDVLLFLHFSKSFKKFLFRHFEHFVHLWFNCFSQQINSTEKETLANNQSSCLVKSSIY